jgi:raffinose/stachyose/melibiose transport system permease protein
MALRLKGRENMNTLNKKSAVILFAAPAVILYTGIVILPIIFSAYLSLTEWSGLGDIKFVGLDNFKALFQDDILITALKNNIIYILIVVGMQMIIGFIVAVLLTYIKKLRGFIQTVYFIPSTMSVIAIAQLFNCFYSVTPLGLFNKILSVFGIGPITFLSEFDKVLPAVSVVEGWQYIGIYMIIFYSALVSISPDVVEAASIDGASRLQLLFRIKIPMIKNVIAMSFILSGVGALKGFAVSYNLTSGGPSHKSELLSTYMYKIAFTNRELGYGSAIAIVIMILSLIFILCINKAVRVDGSED